ncbi:hypothetical protein [Rugosimonospora africana]|uniref:Core-binding (CB) domain-containing protein n=1 Tax=Rugosimonospora africana TaxID=556532 RepID=A0A8J3QT60_9ACTN|nr:hypothetical protein [Rugosimonospora africana]GIH16353.1 hypothetical protein Raf01_45250 [Rugosimonospora africana]
MRARLALICRLAEFTNQYPWQWTCAELEAFFDMLRSGPRPAALSTLRGYQTTMRLFQDFVTDTRYAWPQACRDRFGQAPAVVLHEWNSMVHVGEYEGRPGRRPLTYDEVQVLFDTADQRVDDIRSRGRKGALVVGPGCRGSQEGLRHRPSGDRGSTRGRRPRRPVPCGGCRRGDGS